MTISGKKCANSATIKAREASDSGRVLSQVFEKTKFAGGKSKRRNGHNYFFGRWLNSAHEIGCRVNRNPAASLILLGELDNHQFTLTCTARVIQGVLVLGRTIALDRSLN